jgi:hypothetical protein
MSTLASSYIAKVDSVYTTKDMLTAPAGKAQDRFQLLVI